MNKLMILIGCLSIAATYNKPCNQVTYDMVYRAVVEQSLSTNSIKDRNTSIQTLRKLCRYQKSSWEYKNDTQYPLKRLRHDKHQ